LVGNSSELISHKLKANILTTIDPSWSKFSTEKFTDKEMLFGDSFQSKLTGRVEKETALAKAVLITTWHKERYSSSRKGGQKGSNLFQPCPSINYVDGQGKRAAPHHGQQRYPQRGGFGQGQGR